LTKDDDFFFALSRMHSTAIWLDLSAPLLLFPV
jgi:hypothetical protein